MDIYRPTLCRRLCGRRVMMKIEGPEVVVEEYKNLLLAEIGQYTDASENLKDDKS